MQNTLHKSLQITPVNSSGSETVIFDRVSNAVPEIQPYIQPRSEETLAIFPTPEDTQEQYIAMLLRSQTRKLQPVQLEATQESTTEFTASSVRYVTEAALVAGEQIMIARDNEIARDMVQKPHAHLNTKEQNKFSITEFIFGKPLARALGKGVQMGVETLNFTSPEARRQQFEIEYMQREAEAGKRVLGHNNMQFFAKIKQHGFGILKVLKSSLRKHFGTIFDQKMLSSNALADHLQK